MAVARVLLSDLSCFRLGVWYKGVEFERDGNVVDIMGSDEPRLCL